MALGSKTKSHGNAVSLDEPTIEAALTRLIEGRALPTDRKILEMVVKSRKALSATLQQKLDEVQRKELSSAAAANKMTVVADGGPGHHAPAQKAEPKARENGMWTARALGAQVSSGLHVRDSAQNKDVKHENRNHWQAGADGTQVMVRDGAVVATKSAVDVARRDTRLAVSQTASVIFMRAGVEGAERKALVDQAFAQALTLVGKSEAELQMIEEQRGSARETTQRGVAVAVARVLQRDRAAANAGQPLSHFIDLTDVQLKLEKAAAAITAEKGVNTDIQALYVAYFVNARGGQRGSAGAALQAADTGQMPLPALDLSDIGRALVFAP